MRIGIIVAMDKELRQLQEVFKKSDVLVQKCGIGKVNAALGAQKMINEFHPDVIISSGCAGGNGDDINVQDIVVSSELCYHDVYCGKAIDDTTVYGQVQGLPARYQADSELLRKAISLPTSNIRLHPGLVDMESCAIAQTCYINNVKFISFRVVSDIPLRDTDASQYHDFWNTVAENSFQTTRAFVESL